MTISKELLNVSFHNYNQGITMCAPRFHCPIHGKLDTVHVASDSFADRYLAGIYFIVNITNEGPKTIGILNPLLNLKIDEKYYFNMVDEHCFELDIATCSHEDCMEDIGVWCAVYDDNYQIPKRSEVTNNMWSHLLPTEEGVYHIAKKSYGEIKQFTTSVTIYPNGSVSWYEEDGYGRVLITLETLSMSYQFYKAEVVPQPKW